MKKVFAFLLISTLPALAADPAQAPKPDACGKTVEECQKKVDDLTAQLKQTTIAYGAVRQQRDATQQSLSDNTVNTYVQQQTK